MSSIRNVAGQVPRGVVATGTISPIDTTNRKVVFVNGQHFDSVDHIIFCTGYEYSQPFIRASRDTDEPLFPDGQTIRGLYDHVLYMILYCVNMYENLAPQILERTLEPWFCFQLHVQVQEELRTTLSVLAPSSRDLFQTGVIKILKLWETYYSQDITVKSMSTERLMNTTTQRGNVETSQQPLPTDQLIMGFESVKVSFGDGQMQNEIRSQIRATMSEHMALLEGQWQRNLGR